MREYAYAIILLGVYIWYYRKEYKRQKSESPIHIMLVLRDPTDDENIDIKCFNGSPMSRHTNHHQLMLVFCVNRIPFGFVFFCLIHVLFPPYNYLSNYNSKTVLVIIFDYPSPWYTTTIYIYKICNFLNRVGHWESDQVFAEYL